MCVCVTEKLLGCALSVLAFFAFVVRACISLPLWYLLLFLLCCYYCCWRIVAGVVAAVVNISLFRMQRYMIRIVLMVPVYVIGSYLSLTMREHSFYFTLIRDWYVCACEEDSGRRGREEKERGREKQKEEKMKEKEKEKEESGEWRREERVHPPNKQTDHFVFLLRLFCWFLIINYLLQLQLQRQLQHSHAQL